MNFKESSEAMIGPLQQEIRAEAAQIVTTPGLPSLSFQAYQEFFITGNRLNFEKDYFERRRQLATLALACLNDRSRETKRALEDVIWELCNEYSWSLPAHFEVEEGHFAQSSDVNIDLFAAETGQALAEICEVCADLSPAVTQRVAVELERRLFQPLLRRPWRWEVMENNWSAVVAGSIGMAALSALPKNAPQQQQILQRLEPVFQVYLGSFEADGACLEGIGYWAYGFGYYLYFAEKYRDVLGSDRFLKGRNLPAIAAFPYKALISDQHFVPFSDANESDLPTGLLSYCQQAFGVAVPSFQRANSLGFDHCYRWAHLYRNLIWTKEQETEDRGGSFYFADAQWLIQRNQGFVFAAKAGSNEESHNHNDVGHFIIGDGESLWLTDLGAGEYTKAYFEEQTRYDVLNNRSAGHSVPVINGYEQRPGPYQAREVKYIEHEAGHEFQMELTEVYPVEAGLATYTRTFWVEPQQQRVAISDEMVFKEEGPHKVVQHFISEREPLIDGVSVCWTGKGGTLSLEAFEGEATSTQEQYQGHHGETKAAHRLAITQHVSKQFGQRLRFMKKKVEGGGR